jgi:HEPN domain-containing protein
VTPPPPPPASVSQSWRRVARRDWRRLHVLLDAGDGPGAGIFLQQALEKFLEGYLLERGWPLRKTHELDRLLDAAVDVDASLAPFRPLCERVSGYYLVERYPGSDDGGPDAAQIRLDLEETKRLVAALYTDEPLE